jgi:4a-hydroxytetrahydrobiopterin dehydratase
MKATYDKLFRNKNYILTARSEKHLQREKLAESVVNEALERLNRWKFEHDRIKTRRQFPNFAAALEFVKKVGELAEEADHHPDITFGWGYAEIVLTTHDRAGVTDVDLALARKIDEIT